MPRRSQDGPFPRVSISSIGGAFKGRESIDSVDTVDIPEDVTRKPRGIIGRMLGRTSMYIASSSSESPRPRRGTSPAAPLLPRPINIVTPNHSPSSNYNTFPQTTPDLLSPALVGSFSSEHDTVRPLTRNTLTATERAEIIRRNQKLQRVLGDVPHAASNDGRSTGDLALDNGPLGVNVLGDSGRRARSPLSTTVSSQSMPKYLRRHSSPVSPVFAREASRNHFRVPERGFSPGESFIDLEDSPVAPLPQGQSFASISSTSVASSLEGNKDPDVEDRARRRARLAKLHRYLGSRVPPELVLGTLPNASQGIANEVVARRPAYSKRRSSRASNRRSMSPVPFMSDGEADYRTSQLTEEEKAIFVKRKLKMERMFGERPPQALYRPKPADEPDSLDTTPTISARLRLPVDNGASPSYVQHRYSINSLAYLVDKHDQDSLTELMQYMGADEAKENDSGDEENPVTNASSSAPLQNPPVDSNIDVVPPSPTDSTHSYASSLTTPTTPAATSAFQQRRKRVAKLKSFFGVEYRDLFVSVLDTIETEVTHDRSTGELTAEEHRDLVNKLRMLKTKRDQI